MAALARIEGDKILLKAEILTNDGREHISGEVRLARGDEKRAAILADTLLARASPELRALFTA
jgi:hydroxymethylbilane synthase